MTAITHIAHTCTSRADSAKIIQHGKKSKPTATRRTGTETVLEKNTLDAKLNRKT